MVGEVTMDLLQPRMMSRIVDEGVLGLNHGGVGDMNVIWALGLRMILIVLLGCFCGSMNNVFVHISGQNIGNEMRKDCFDRIMKFSFPQMNRFGAGFPVCPWYASHFVVDVWKHVLDVSPGRTVWGDCRVRVSVSCRDTCVLPVEIKTAVLEIAGSARSDQCDHAGGCLCDPHH